MGEKFRSVGAAHKEDQEESMANEPQSMIQQLEANISSAVLGKAEVVRHCVVALLAGEHVLLEDVPGVGKTLVGKALAKSVSGEFRRIQFTPDMLPADITGSSFYDAKSQQFVFSRGPVFANVVLADEINRTTPRTQSALLEAMSENQVTIDGVSHPLPRPFMVIATQNPLEFEGTYPLPESQLDRFLLRISVGYPERSEELQVLASHREGEPVDKLQPVLSGEQICSLQEQVRQVKVDESISGYLLDIVEATRRSDELHVGVSIRGALSLYRAAQASALIDGRDYIVPDDVKALTVAVLSHRVITRGFLHSGQREAIEALIERLVADVPVPS